MTTRTISRDRAEAIVDGDDGTLVLLNEYVNASRWESNHRVVFVDDREPDKPSLGMFFYTLPLTELQEGSVMFEDLDDVPVYDVEIVPARGITFKIKQEEDAQ